MGPPRPSIRAIDLDEEDPCLAEMSSQRGTVGAGALNADSVKLPVALQPLCEGAIAGRRCGKVTIAKVAPEVINHGGMVALSVRVHAASDTNRRPCHAGHALPLLFAAVRWAHAAVGIGGQASDGRLCAGSYEVTPPGRSRATTSSAGPTDRPKDSSTRQAYGESDPAEDVSHILTGLRHVSQSRPTNDFWNACRHRGRQFVKWKLAPRDSTRTSRCANAAVRTSPAATQFLQYLESV